MVTLEETQVTESVNVIFVLSTYLLPIEHWHKEKISASRHNPKDLQLQLHWKMVINLLDITWKMSVTQIIKCKNIILALYIIFLLFQNCPLLWIGLLYETYIKHSKVCDSESSKCKAQRVQKSLRGKYYVTFIWKTELKPIYIMENYLKTLTFIKQIYPDFISQRFSIETLRL